MGGKDLLPQQTEVHVSVGLIDFRGNVATVASQITQDSINSKMISFGLLPVKLVVNTNLQVSTAISKSNMNTKSSGHSGEGPNGNGVLIGIIVGVLTLLWLLKPWRFC